MLLKRSNKSTRGNNLLSRSFVCLSASLLSLRSNAFFSRGFTSSELSVILHNRNYLLRMSTSTTPTKSTTLEASASEKKKLLHDKEGSMYPRDPTGTKQVLLLNVTKIIRYPRHVLTNHLDHFRKLMDWYHSVFDTIYTDVKNLLEWSYLWLHKWLILKLDYATISTVIFANIYNIDKVGT